MQKKLEHKSGMNRDRCLYRLANGESFAQIERAIKMKPNEIYIWAKKWGIQGMSQKQAKELLEEAKQEKPGAINPVTVQSVKTESTPDPVPTQPPSQEPEPVLANTIGVAQALADAIECARALKSDNDILRGVARGDLFFEDADVNWDPLFDCDIFDLAHALINGYHVIKTKEEIIKEVFFNPHWPVYEMSADDAYRVGIRHALQTMGYDFGWLK